jgi:menaquinone-dependent protoporphyrinogen oxidase
VAHRTFAGALRRAELAHDEQVAFREVPAPEGDFRNWSDIHAWAEEIAVALTSEVAGTART